MLDLIAYGGRACSSFRCAQTVLCGLCPRKNYDLCIRAMVWVSESRLCVQSIMAVSDAERDVHARVYIAIGSA
jgi:hypothetical protein